MKCIYVVHGWHIIVFQKPWKWGFPGSPVVKTWCSQCRGHRFNLWYRNSVPEISVRESLVRSHRLCGVASKQNKPTPGLLLWLSGKESTSQHKKYGFSSWPGGWHAVEQLSLCLTTIEPVLWSPGAATTEAHTPWNLGSATRKATTVRSLQSQLESSPHLLQLEKSPCSNEGPAQSKSKNANK